MKTLRMVGKSVLVVLLIVLLGGLVWAAVDSIYQDAYERARAQSEYLIENERIDSLDALIARLTATHFGGLPPMPGTEPWEHSEGPLPVDWQNFPQTLQDGLIGYWEGNVPVYEVFIYQDQQTREIIILNSDNVEIYSMDCPYEVYCRPETYALYLRPDLYSGKYTQQEIAAFIAERDPARAGLRLTLVPTANLFDYLYAKASQQSFVEALLAQGNSAQMMMRQSGGSGTLNDLDGDGVSNREEILAGTDPEDTGDYLRITNMLLIGGSREIWWPTASNRQYSVMTATGGVALLSPQNWTAATQWLDGTGSGIVFTDTLSGIDVAFHHVQVRETDANTNGLPDWWEIEHFGGLTNIPASGDEEDDGLNNLEELYYGYDPQQSERDLIHSAFKSVTVNGNNPGDPNPDDGTEFFDYTAAGGIMGLAGNAADGFGEINGEPHFSGCIVFNNDMDNLYIGVSGIKLSGDNVFMMFIDTGTGGQTNLQHLSPATQPYGFSRSRNLHFPAGQFTPSVGLLLGGRYADGQNFDSFNFGGNDTGQGVYRLSDNSDFPGFTDAGPSPISQWARDFSGDTVSAHAGVEVAIALDDLGVSPGDTIKVATLFGGGANDSNDRFFSGEVYGKSITGTLDGNDNLGTNPITVVGTEVQLSGPEQTLPESEYPGFDPDDVMIQAFFWNADSPNEDPTKEGEGEWYDKVVSNVGDMAAAGFTKAYLPVPTKGESGLFSMGYDPYDHYDVGQHDQKGGFDTRFGNLSELTNLTATLRASNIVPVVDTVMNHMRQASGSKTFVYPHNTFEKGTNDFHASEEGHKDELPPYHLTDEFGSDYFDVDQLAPHMRLGLKVWGDWLIDTIGIEGFRFDLTQRMEPWWVYEWMNYPAMRGRFAAFEYWRLATPVEMQEWLELTGKRGAIWDWFGRDLLYTMCYTNTFNFDISQLTNSFAWLCPSHAIAYCENHDTYAPAKTGEPEITSRGIIRDKGMAYSVVTFGEALPSIYWHDYYDKPYHDGVTTGTNLYQGYSGEPLKAELDRQLWIRRNILGGPQSYLVTNASTKTDLFIAQRAGTSTRSGGILAVNDHDSQSISNWAQTPWVSMQLRDWVVTSSYVTVSTDTNGFAWIGATSRSYRVYAPTNALSWGDQQ